MIKTIFKWKWYVKKWIYKKLYSFEWVIIWFEFIFNFLDVLGTNLYVPNETMDQKLKRYNSLKSANKLPRIVFFFVLNGRSSRQIFRTIKAIYDDIHFYYFHIDQVNYRKKFSFKIFMILLFSIRKANDFSKRRIQ